MNKQLDLTDIAQEMGQINRVLDFCQIGTDNKMSWQEDIPIAMCTFYYLNNATCKEFFTVARDTVKIFLISRSVNQ